MGRSTKVSSLILIAFSVSLLLARSDTVRNVQYSDEEQITSGSLLLASEKLGDPNFAKSVILIIEADPEKGAMGLVINRQSEINISTVFPKAERTTKDPVYVGGPVETDTAQALIRSASKSDGTAHVVGDVYVTGSREVIEKSVTSKAEASKFRLYLGYAGWAPGQLEAELRVGAWSILHGTSKIVFDEQPDTLWARLTRESHMRLAMFFSGTAYGKQSLE